MKIMYLFTSEGEVRRSKFLHGHVPNPADFDPLVARPYNGAESPDRNKAMGFARRFLGFWNVTKLETSV